MGIVETLDLKNLRHLAEIIYLEPFQICKELSLYMYGD